MIFPMNPVANNAPQAQGNYNNMTQRTNGGQAASGLQQEMQNATQLGREELLSEQEEVNYRSQEDEDRLEEYRQRRGNRRGSGSDHECETCKHRKYQDGSDDPGVSFKSATKLDPGRAATAVRSHEQEHVVRNQAKAEREGNEIVSQNVMIHTAICPECGRTYVSGGTTTTVSRNASENPLANQFTVGVPDAKGANVDSDA